MKKIIFLAVLLALMAMPASAAVKKATLINPEGKKVVVEVSSYRAQLFFGAGYVLMTDKLGAIPGGDIYQPINIYDSLTTGSSYYTATSSSGSTNTLNYKDLNGTSFISFTSNVNTYTFTLPATSTMMQILPKIGSTRKWLIHNATTTAATTLTIAAGGGMDLVSVTNADDVLDGAEFAQLTCTQIPYLVANNENIMCIVDELANSD